MGTDMSMFIEVRHLNKWHYIGYSYYSLPTSKNDPIKPFASSTSVDRNYLLNYIISGYCKYFGEGIGGKQLIEKREIPTSGDNKCSDSVLNTYNNNLNHNCAKHASYVFLSELKEITKFEPFKLHGYIHKTPTTMKNMSNHLYSIMQNGIFDITNWVIPCSSENDLKLKNNNEYEFVQFQSKCITSLINRIEKELTSYFGTNIFDNNNDFTFSPEDVRIIFWYDE